jgi:hypothetical protein
MLSTPDPSGLEMALRRGRQLTRGASERWVVRRVALSRASDGMADDLQKQWGGEDLNLRPTDYESAALTD